MESHRQGAGAVRRAARGPTGQTGFFAVRMYTGFSEFCGVYARAAGAGFYGTIVACDDLPCQTLVCGGLYTYLTGGLLCLACVV